MQSAMAILERPRLQLREVALGDAAYALETRVTVPDLQA